jgi:hypothetical protein
MKAKVLLTLLMLLVSLPLVKADSDPPPLCAPNCIAHIDDGATLVQGPPDAFIYDGKFNTDAPWTFRVTDAHSTDVDFITFLFPQSPPSPDDLQGAFRAARNLVETFWTEQANGLADFPEDANGNINLIPQAESPVPETSTLVLTAAGLIVLALVLKRTGYFRKTITSSM